MKTKIGKRKVIVFVIIGIFLIATPITGKFQQSELKNPDQVVIDIIGFGNPIANYDLDPAIDYETLGLGFINLVYEGLVTYDTNNPNTIIGQLAYNNWTISPNGTVYTFYLKHNIKYQDGTPFNAWTMKYSFDRMIITNALASSAYLLQKRIIGADSFQNRYINITDANNYLKAGGVTVINDYTLQITLSNPFQPFINLLACCPKAVSPAFVINHLPANYTTNQSDPLYGMISLHNEFPTLTDWTKLGLESNHNPAISGIVPQSGVSSPSYNTWIASHMSGTGPYKLYNDSSTEISFIKNVDWVGTFAQNSPNQITWRMDSDSNNRIFEFLNGQTDELLLNNIPKDEIFSFIDSKGSSIIKDVTAYKTTQPSNYRLVFSFNESLTKFVIPAKNITATWNETHIIDANLVEYSTNNTQLAFLGNPFTSLKFREAFACAFDYNTFVTETSDNIYAKRSDGIIPSALEGHVDNLIDQNIIPSYNSTLASILFKEIGWRGNITLVDNGKPNNFKYITDTMLQSEINSLNIGIRINVINNTANPTSMLRDDPPIGILGWTADYPSAYNFVFPLLDSKGIYPIFFSHYDNPLIDKLLNDSVRALDYNTRMNDYKNIELTAAHDYESIYLEEPINILLVHNWMQNFNSSGSLNPFVCAPNFQYISKSNPSSSSTTSLSSTSVSNTPDFLIMQAVFVLAFVSIKFKKKR